MIEFEGSVRPMLAVKGRPFSSEEYLYEIKWDGTRCIAFLDPKEETVRLQNRRLIDITNRYPEFSDLYTITDQKAIVDGEIVVLKEGRPSFRLLQMREHIDDKFLIEERSKLFPAVYVVFDILFLDHDITTLPLSKRKEKLDQLGKHKHVLIPDYIIGEGEEYFKGVVRKGFEGVMAKRLDSPYLPGVRSRYWIKIKKKNTVDAVVVGYLSDKRLISSLLLGVYDRGKLRYIGRVAAGLDEETQSELYSKLQKINRHIEIEGIPEQLPIKPVWVKPTIVCEVEFLEVEPSGLLRSPVLLRIRYDKPPEECTYDQLSLEKQK